MTAASSQRTARQTLDTRTFIEAAWPRDPRDAPSVRRWRAAGRVSLAVLLGFSAMQHYLFDVQLTIMAMPGVIVFAATPDHRVLLSATPPPAIQ